tara:strand:- start:1733 stop:2605 length:873 start_codon:yes stop_codon:yes gene_type:complete
MKNFIKKFKYNPYEIADGIVIEIWNLYEELRYIINKLLGKYYFLKKNNILKDKHKNQRIFLLGNAPSLNDFDLTKLKNEIVIMVNRSFTHKDYEIIKPEYHIFVDPKLANGIWPIEYLDTVLRKNPKVNLILNAEWFYLKNFEPYRNKKNVFWVKNKIISLLFNNFNYDLTTNYSCSGLGVVGHGFPIAAYTKANKVYLIGVEGDGVIRLMANQNSHFSGKDPDYGKHTSLDWARDLSIMSRGMRMLNKVGEFYKRNGTEIINLNTKKSVVLDPFSNEDWNNIFKDSNQY